MQFTYRYTGLPGIWTKGIIEPTGHSFTATIWRGVPCHDGIEGGTITKLQVRCPITNRVVLDYWSRWILPPRTDEARAMVRAAVKEFDGG